MDNKILEILLDMQKEIKDMKSEMKDMKSEMKDINTKIDRLEYKMTDGFETLELLTENNTNELNKVKIKVSKLEKRVAEFNTVNYILIIYILQKLPYSYFKDKNLLLTQYKSYVNIYILSIKY